MKYHQGDYFQHQMPKVPGPNLPWILFLVLVVAKLSGVNLPWVAVFAPLWIPGGVIIGLLAVAFIIMIPVWVLEGMRSGKDQER